MRTEKETYGQYVIKWNNLGARVFFLATGKMADDQIFRSKELAIEWIDKTSSSEVQKRRDHDIPTAEEFCRALGSLKLSANELLMLTAHRSAEGRRLTAQELASAAGKTSYKFANRWYGGIGRRVAEFLNLPMKHDDDMQWTQAIAHYDDDAWVMHPEFAEALDRLNIT